MYISVDDVILTMRELLEMRVHEVPQENEDQEFGATKCALTLLIPYER